MRPAARTRVIVLAAFLGGLLTGMVGMVGMVALGPDAAPEPPMFDATGQLERLPAGPADVLAETVELGRGFQRRHKHGGPTFNFVVHGRVRIVQDNGSAQEYGPGGFFLEPADRPHTIEVLSDARLDVLRLLPPGVAATTDLPPR
jgi:quercetin dioxygenase-like cupin family protein